MTEPDVSIRAVKPAMTRYLLRSALLLGQQLLPGDEAVHDVRVYMKRLRATLKLVKPCLDERSYRREYDAARNAGLLLADWRDTAVLRSTMKTLKKESPELFDLLSSEPKASGLFAGADLSWEEAAARKKRAAGLAEQMKKAAGRIRFLSLADPDPSLMAGSLEESYREACRAYITCRNRPKPRLIHDFRKKSKTFLYQLRYFRPLNPPAVKSIETKIDRLTEVLGRYNDLGEVIRVTGYVFGEPGNTPVMDLLWVLVKDMQDRQLLKVWVISRDIFRPGSSLRDLLPFLPLMTAPRAG